MPSNIETAIAKIESAGDRLCENQVYYFDDYDPETGDATALCKRLGIPFTDDIVIEYPAKRTFAPISSSKLAKLSKRLGAALPDDYARLLVEFGPCHLPGDSVICFHSPESVISATCDGWGFDDPSTMPVLAISPYHRDCDGDSIGFLRAGRSFAPELYVFRHELRYLGDDDATKWTERMADSLSEFIISYIDSLA
jgi:hypothetical protein